MIKFEDFFKVPYPRKTKVKFNKNAGDAKYPAWDYLYDDDPEWINMNAWRTKQNNNTQLVVTCICNNSIKYAKTSKYEVMPSVIS